MMFILSEIVLWSQEVAAFFMVIQGLEKNKCKEKIIRRDCWIMGIALMAKSGAQLIANPLLDITYK